MRRIAAMLVTVLVAAAIAAPIAEAQSRKKKKRAYVQPYAGQTYAAPRSDGYKEFIAEKHPVGSSSWWEQMDREGRGGQSRAN